MKLLCTADLHLGAGPDLGRVPVGRESRLADQAQTWLTICERAVDERVDAVLFAGDAFHHRRPNPACLMAFRAGLQMLEESGIPVVAIAGNHDTTSLAEPCALSVFDGQHFRLARRPQHAVVYERSTGAPTYVACLPWAPAVGTVQDMALGLVTSAQALRAQVPEACRSILLGHWSVSGASLPTDILTNDLREPVLPVAELADQGWDAVVFGHIHLPQTIVRPSIFYVGSPHVVDFGEADCDHGYWIWEDGVATFYELRDRPFQTLDVVVADDASAAALLDPAYYDGVQRAIVRVRLTCSERVAARIDTTGIRRALLEAGAYRVYQVRMEVRRHSRARAQLDESQGPLAAVATYADAQGLDSGTKDAMITQTRTYLEDR